jgi:very-short-patch-repair endonuclease
MQFNNRHKVVQKRKELRNNPTEPEVFLWLRLKNNQTGFKFRRQHSIGPYILDLYCPEKKLCIELDGNQHYLEEGEQSDLIRTKYLNSYGIQVVRFSNLDILQNIEGVLMKIQEELNAPPLTPP